VAGFALMAFSAVEDSQLKEGFSALLKYLKKEKF
jgi:hypothetical protein